MLLAAMPLVVTLCGFAYSRAQTRPSQFESWLSQTFGFATSVAQVQTVKPGVTRYTAIALSDPEIDKPIARCNTLQLHRGHSMTGYELHEVSINADELSRIWRVLHERLLANPLLLPCPSQFTITDLQFKGRDGSLDCAALRGTLTRHAGISRADVELELRTPSEFGPLTVAIQRHAGAGLGTDVRLETGGRALPCWFLAADSPWLPAAIRNARFSGKVFASCDNSAADSMTGWKAEVTGRFEQVLLDELIAPRFGHELTGLADLQVQTAKFSSGQINELELVIQSGPGTISGELLQAAVRELQLTVANSPLENVERVTYMQFAARIRIDQQGTTITGMCADLPAGAVIQLANGKVIMQPTTQPQPCAALLRCLVPASLSHVPATEQLKPLLQLMPLSR